MNITKFAAMFVAAIVIWGAASPSRAHEPNQPGTVAPGGWCPPGEVCEPRAMPPDRGDPGYYLPPRYEAAYLGCNRARRLLVAEGFRYVETLRCGGRYHSFSGWRYGQRFLVRVYSRSGEIRIIRPL